MADGDRSQDTSTHAPTDDTAGGSDSDTFSGDASGFEHGTQPAFVPPTSFAPDVEEVSPGTYSRRNRRTIPRVLVAIDAPQVAEHPWVVDAIDISSTGMGLVLPPELAEGTRAFLSFSLDEGTEFSRVSAIVRHQMNVYSGGVSFEAWSSADRLKLLEYLVAWYERDQ